MPKRPPFRDRPVTLRNFFKEWRQSAGLTQQQLADRLGTTKTRVSMKESGKEGWDDAYLGALADALGLTEPAHLIMRNPLAEEAPWSLSDHLQKASPAKRREIMRVVAQLSAVLTLRDL